MKILIIITFALLFASCSKSPNLSDLVSLTEKGDILNIKVAPDINIYDRCLRYYSDTEGEYITLRRLHPNEIYDELVFVDIHSSEEISNVKVYREGPNAINGGLYSYDIINRDTIVLSSKYLPILYFITSDGKIIQQYDLGVDNVDGITEFLMTSIVNLPYTIKDGIIDFPQSVPYTRSYKLPNPPDFKFAHCPLAYLIDTITGEIVKSKVGYPHLYDNDDMMYHDEVFSRVFDGENYVYSFQKHDSLIVTTDYKTSKTIYAKSRYMEDITNKGVPMGSDMSAIEKILPLALYGNIVYDPYRKVFYRFCFFDYKYSEPYTLETGMCVGDFSIMIIDSNFKIIGETRFPANKFVPRIFFVNEEGLWLSENNINRLGKDMTEDEFVFRCLKLQEEKK